MYRFFTLGKNISKMKLVYWIKSNKWLVIILFLATALRVYNVDFQSIWLDEIHTINEANPSLSFSEMYQLMMITEPHPPLYFILVKIVFTVFGYTTFVLRCFSALLGVGGLLAVYFLGKELMNKQVGIISALLLSVNYFHLYHSQDGRMYSMLFLTTTLSFLFLAKFIKKPSYQTAVLHGFFAVLMIYTHFFALFALFAEYLILLFFILKPFKTDSKKFFFFSCISGLITLVLYLPSLKLFFAASERTSIWIPIPEVDVYTQMFKEFFGQSEIVLFFVIALLFYGFIRLFESTREESVTINPDKNELNFSFFILITWIMVTLLIPLVLSFVNLPMLISRYFINILPALIILISIGIFYIRNHIVKLGIIALIIVFSLIDVVIVKRFYTSTYKTQFRELSLFIQKNKKTDEKVVSSLAWYFPFFLNNKEVKTNLIENNLDSYVAEMISGKEQTISFWYADGHQRTYNPSQATLDFLNANFVVDLNSDFYDCWTKHYILKKDYNPKVDISAFYPLKMLNGDRMNYSFESFNVTNDKIIFNGWAYLENQDALTTRIYVLAFDEQNNYTILNIQNTTRKDVTTYFKSKFNIDNSGFSAEIDKTAFRKGNYKLGILLFDDQNKSKGLVITDKKVTID